jgi:nitroreductase
LKPNISFNEKIMTTSELTQALQWRYATKSFDANSKLSDEQVEALTNALHTSPSSFGLQPWKFLIVENPEIREQLKAYSWNQPQVTDASHLVVLCVKESISEADISQWIARLAEVQSTPLDKLAPLQGMIHGFTGAMDAATMQQWNTRQVYIALGQLMTAAAVLNIDSCPLEGISPSDYDQVLGLSGTGYKTVVACALGIRSSDDKYATAPKARYPREHVISVIR